MPSRAESRELDEARDLLCTVDRFSSRAFARLDTKLRLLNRLIEEADVRLKALGAAAEAKDRPRGGGDA